MTDDQFPVTEIPRDRYGRPMVVPPGDGKKAREPYRRTTTFAGALEDTFGLTRYQLRNAVVGMGQRPDLVLAASATDPSDKAGLDEIVGKATEHATAAATTGTSLHALTERLDRGQKLGRVPEPYGDDLKAYEKAIAGFEWLEIEKFRVLDGWKVAGTPDRIGRTPDGLTVVADLKTGSIDYPSSWALQLSLYARSLPYDVATDTRGPATPDLNLDYGLIIHLPAGKASCRLYRIDLVKGWAACMLAKQVWDWRGTKGLLEVIDETQGIAPTLVDLAARAETTEQLTELWRQAKRDGTVTDAFLAMCEERHRQLTAAP